MVPVPLLWQHVAKETASAKKKCTTLLKKLTFKCLRLVCFAQGTISRLFHLMTRAKHQQQPACITWFCSYLQKHNMEGHGVDVERVKAKLKTKATSSQQRDHICPHAVQTRSTLHQLITTCCVKAQLLVTTPGSQRHPQIFCNIGGDLNRGVTFSLVLSLIVFCGCLA